MADRNTLEQGIDEILRGPSTAEASPREIDRAPPPEPEQAFDDMRDLLEEPEDSNEDDSDDEGGSGDDDE